MHGEWHGSVFESTYVGGIPRTHNKDYYFGHEKKSLQIKRLPYRKHIVKHAVQTIWNNTKLEKTFNFSLRS